LDIGEVMDITRLLITLVFVRKIEILSLRRIGIP